MDTTKPACRKLQCAEIGWKMTRHITSKPKEEEHAPSEDTTPV
jgi:hypothetical protein